MNPLARGMAAVTLTGCASLALAADGDVSIASLDRIGRAIVVQKCPRPIEVKTVLIRAEKAGSPDDEMESTACPGLRMAIYRANATKPPRERPMSLVLEEANPQLAAVVGVGAAVDGVRAALGPPTVMLGDNLVYALAARDTITFEVQAGRVRAVTWTWDVE